MAKKLNEAKRLKHARQHLRDCPARNCTFNEVYFCVDCNEAKNLFKSLHLELPTLPNEYKGVMW